MEAEPTSTNCSASDERPISARRLYVGIIVILFGLYAFQLWLHAIRTSATVDEPVHILAGYLHWCGDFGFNSEHPPLLKMVATVPLIGKDLVNPPWDCGSKITSKADSYFFGNLFLVKNGLDKLVIQTRMSAALISLLLALLVFLAGTEMFGRWAGVTALTLFAFEPNLIAHGSLVTTDMAVSVGLFATVYALYRYVKTQKLSHILMVGVGIGVALATKHSGLLILPIVVLLLVGDVLLSRYVRSENKQGLINELSCGIAVCAGVFLIGLAFLWASYGFRYYALPNAATATTSVTNLLRKSHSERVLRVINQARILPESYVYGLADIVATQSRSTSMFDRVYPTGQWLYFPLAFVVKTSVALLGLLVLGLLTLKLYRERTQEMLFLLLPPLVYFAVSLLSGINIGVRHLLPIYPFLIVIAAAGIHFSGQKYHGIKHIVTALLLFHAATAVQTAPNYIAFANDFWGGTNNSYRIFRDSNVENQQNLKLVAEYIGREDIRDCWFAAYGSAALARAHQQCRLLPTTLGLWYTLGVSEEVIEPVPPVLEGTVLLSVTVLPPTGGTEYLPITRTIPIGQIGGSVFVYRGRFEVPLLAALSHARRAQQLVRRKRLEEAVADGRKAVELAPDDPRTRFWLGMALAHAKQSNAARRELEMSMQLSQTRQDYLPTARIAKWPGDVDDVRALRSTAQRELLHLQ